MNFCLTNARHFVGNTIFLWLFLSTHYLQARKTRWLLVCDVTDDMTARHAYPAPFKSCHVRATVRNADINKGNRKTADFTCFIFLRENRRSASKGFFLAWLNSGKKQTRLTTRLVVFSAFSAWRDKNGFVADYDAIDKPRERRLRSHAKKKPLDTQCRGFRLLMISEIMSALYGKPRNSVENSNGTVHPGGNFPEKK